MQPQVQSALAPELADLIDRLLGELRDIRLLLSRVAWNQTARLDQDTSVGATATAERPREAERETGPQAAGESSTPADLPIQYVGWSAARDAVMRRDYPAGVDIETLLQRLNALPGRRLAKADVWQRTGPLKVRRTVAGSIALADTPAGDAPVPVAASVPGVAPTSVAPSRIRFADVPTIRKWAGERGLDFDGHDLSEINARAERLGVPIFVLDTPLARRQRLAAGA